MKPTPVTDLFPVLLKVAADICPATKPPDLFTGVIAPVAIPVPSLKLASFVPSMFHFAALGCSPNTTDQLA